MSKQYDALLILSFGGPESRDDVIPFLENVLRGRNVPKERMLEVAEHYYQFDGISPINKQIRDLIAALQPELERQNIALPIYWGNRNWHPLLTDTLQTMANDGIQQALAFVTSAYSSYSGCRQYREDIEQAIAHVGETAPSIDKIRVFYNHPDFIAANATHLQKAIDKFPQEQQQNLHIAFTAHSIPHSMSNSSDYEQQLQETCRLVTEKIGFPKERWQLVYQSRSGRPTDPWLEPDILDHIKTLKQNETEQNNVEQKNVEQLVIMPIGFLSDHLEVLFDLDNEAVQLANELGIVTERAATVGTNPQFIRMIGKLITERTKNSEPKAVGCFEAHHNLCPTNCCPAPQKQKSINRSSVK